MITREHRQQADSRKVYYHLMKQFQRRKKKYARDVFLLCDGVAVSNFSVRVKENETKTPRLLDEK